MVNAHESDKARNYIQQLDDARCSGRWADVAELCRKVDKHAPHRQCLTLTARCEAQIAAYATQRPATAASTAPATTPPTSLSQSIPSLLTAIEGQREPRQDALQATVCLGWLHYVLEEPGLAVARLPKDFAAVASSLSSGSDALSAWTRVCLVKGAYLKGSAQEKTGAITEAAATYSTMIPWLSASPNATDSLQARMWSENLLVRLSQLSDQSRVGSQHASPADALRTYRYWAKFSDATAKSGGLEGPNSARYRRLAWRAYYDTLSSILRHNTPYHAEDVPATSEKGPIHSQSSARLRQRAELRRVETVYETLVLKETQFPKASGSNRDVEAWVDSVIDNWRILCGPTWTDADLGEGGKEGAARSVLDILYRAATKTFHSTLVLRYLFIVHASLAEFDLAFKAYDSYVEIITRGKDRAEKSGEADVGIDHGSTVLRTSAEAIRLLCRFGAREDAEKARDIGHSIERWLEQSEQIQSASDAGSTISADTELEPVALALAHSAIGVSQAHWARYTYETEKRGELQAKAILSLKRSLSPALGDSNNLEALYALALVLADTRDISAAIKVVKRALSPATKNATNLSADGALSDASTSEFGRERKLIPLWHLLALLLTARSDFAAAEKACEAAFEQFGDPSVLFGDDAGVYRSEHLNQAQGPGSPSYGIVDQFETYEKSAVLHIKMTQLSLLETTDGASTAVDGCDGLVALYNRLFGDLAGEKSALDAPPVNLVPPKSAIGTIRGSIFRGRGSVKAQPTESPARNASVRSSKGSTIATQAGTAPEIQVTEDGAVENGGHHHHHLFHHRHQHGQQQGGLGRSPSKLQKRSSASLRRESVSNANETPEVPPLLTNGPNGTQTYNADTRAEAPGRLSTSSNPQKSTENNDRPLRTIPHNMEPTSPPLEGGQPPRQDIRLHAPVPNAGYIPPDPRFSKLQAQRQKVSLLVDIWLFIAGLYTRAQMFNDAREAVSEALKLAESFEAQVLAESSTARALADNGWGGGKSVEELFADVFAARGELLLAQSLKQEARPDFERALLHYPDHPRAIVGLSDILLDIYNEIIPLEPVTSSIVPSSGSSIPKPATDTKSASTTQHLTSHIPSAENKLFPPELNRLAARDRAFGLLSVLTKLGTGWDSSEAWYALAKAYEGSGQVEKTKEVLWWCVELEDTRPLRNWSVVTMGGYVL